MSEREIADLKKELYKYKDYIKYLKRKIKEKDKKIHELTLLVNAKIRFMKEMRKIK